MERKFEINHDMNNTKNIEIEIRGVETIIDSIIISRKEIKIFIKFARYEKEYDYHEEDAMQLVNVRATSKYVEFKTIITKQKMFKLLCLLKFFCMFRIIFSSFYKNKLVNFMITNMIILFI